MRLEAFTVLENTPLTPLKGGIIVCSVFSKAFSNIKMMMEDIGHCSFCKDQFSSGMQSL